MIATVDVAGWLESGAPFGGAGPVRRIDTHAASIFLCGDRAWKIKRPVRLGYLDFSTARARHDVLQAECRLNRRTAPDLYIAVHAITLRDGALALDGPGEAIDWVLEMRRFPDDALLDHRARHGGLRDATLMQLAGRLADFHRHADIGGREGGAERMRRVVQGNAASLETCPAILAPAKVDRLIAHQMDLLDRHAALLDDRARDGRVRRVHGDLHLGNIAMIDDVPTPFDCLEFDAELATTDVLYDLAFLLMDLWARDLRHEANIVFNRYMDLSPADEAGIGLLPLFMSVRATIRAHVRATRAQMAEDRGAAAEARDYLDRAARLIEPVPPLLIAIGGLSGTGKSTLARAVGGLFGGPPGARILRSDVLRKRLAGVPIETALPPGHYTKAASAAVYAELGRLALQGIGTGQSVLADAVFGTPAERTAIRQAAARAGVPFQGCWLALPEGDRIRRIAGRGPDASDATEAVARAQSRAIHSPRRDWQILSARDDVDRLRREMLGLLAPGRPRTSA